VSGPVRASVVVVAYRSRDHLGRGLPGLLADPAVGDVVVVDNSGDPGTAALVAALGGRVRYVDPGANLGFARGCNLGARLTGDPVVAFLNPDVVLTRGLGDLAGVCAVPATVVVAGGLTDGSAGGRPGNARRRVTPALELRRAVLGARVGAGRPPEGAGPGPVDQVDGALLVLSRAAFTGLGGFDERFELYYEDVDLCDRARAVGTVLLDPRPWGTHAAGASARTSAGPAYLVFRVSRTRYLRLRHGRTGALVAVMCAALELVSRSATRQPEGDAVRLRALRLVLAEARHPGSVAVLA
jgi:GT2 family glycosyltransferase